MNNRTDQQLLNAFQQLQSGRLPEAEKGFRQVLSQDTNNIHALNLLGVVCLQSGRHAESIDFLLKANSLSPNDPETLNNLGLAQGKSGETQAAVSNFQRAIRVGGANPSIVGNLGAALVEGGRAEDALQHLTQAARSAPPTPDILANIAKALSALGRFEEARPVAERAAQAAPDSPEIKNIHGEIALKQGRLGLASKCFEAATRLAPDNLDAQINRATVFKETGEFELAGDLLRELAEDYPTSAEPHFNLGVLHEQLGETRLAAERLRAAIGIDEYCAKAYYQLAQLKGLTHDAGLRPRIEKLLENGALSASDHLMLHFAVATLLENDGDFTDSLRHLRQAHDLVRNTYDPEATNQMHARQRKVFAQPAVLKAEAEAGSRPLFVLGMPRSGTSLAEQVLSAHSAIDGTGESSVLTDCSNEAARLARKPFPECMESLSAEQLAQIGANYRERICSGHEAKWVIDKTPLNFQLIGFARSILPEARFIHCHRDPLNTCFSMYKIPFDQNQNYAASFESLGHFYCAYRDLMEFWKTIAGDTLSDLRYEDIVEDLEREAGRLLDWLGLEFETAVLEFHQQKRLVRTPSATQVNQPIYRGSLSLAEKYGDGLRHLRAALAACYG